MAKLTNGSSWNNTHTQTAATQTYTFATAKKYVDKDISLTVAPQQGTLNSKSSVQGTNVTLSDSDTSGIKVTGVGTGTVTKAGWIPVGDASATAQTQKYISKITLPKSKTVQLDDGIYTWTWTTDANGNVTII